MEHIYYFAPNKTAYELVSPEFRKTDALFLDVETIEKCEVIDDLGENSAIYNKAWDLVRAAQ